jgi:ribonuclease HII
MGPFVVVATAWRVPQELAMEQLHELMSPEIMPLPLNLRKQTGGAAHVPLGDSKRVYSGKFAWESLCLGAHFLLESVEDSHKHKFGSQSLKVEEIPGASRTGDTGVQLYPQDWIRVKKVPWFSSLLLEGPAGVRIADSLYVSALEEREAARSKMRSLGCELVAARGRLIDEIEWNRLVEHFQNKSMVLSELTLGLARDLANEIARSGESIEIYCDKHGGRNRYQSLLMNTFEDQWFDTHAETSKLSRYSTNWGGRPLMIQFRVEGDSLVPSAAASILAKWSRELAMKSLNEFWVNQAAKHGAPIPKPTAGYYVDAMRFAGDIEELAARHGPHKSEWWRVK